MTFKYLSITILMAIFMFSAEAQTKLPTMDEANALFQAQKWSEAAKAFEAITKDQPTNARAFYWWGASLYAMSNYTAAVEVFHKSVDIGHNPQPMFELAKSYARLNEKESALEWIEKALAANLPNPRRVGTEVSFAGFHDDPRFIALADKGSKAAMVCMNTPGYRQFDFWVGEWDVFNKNNRQVGTNSVKMLEDGCIIAENWTSAQPGMTGKSFNFYNPTTGKWHQSYMDNAGSNWMMDGAYKDGELRFEGTIFSPTGNVLVHMTFFNMGADKVRQWAETSSDEGKTWSVIWDATYVRKK